MITKDEIDQKALEFEINPSNVQRDYVFGWLLYGLFTVSNLRGQLFLKGGNALRKCYFANTRFSSDLDLGIPGDVAEDVLLRELNLVCDHIGARSGVRFATERTRVEEKFVARDFQPAVRDLKVFEARVYFQDFYGNSAAITLKVSMDLTRFDRLLLPCQQKPLIHPYSDA